MTDLSGYATKSTAWTPASGSGTCAPSNDAPLARAVGRLLFYSGVRIAEVVARDVDVPLSARKGKVIVWSGKGETSREIPLLDGTACASVTEFRTERASWPGATDNPALLPNRHGGRPTTRAVDQLIDELATDANILATDLQREVVDRLAAAEQIYYLSELGEEAIHDWGGVHSDFHEFVLIDRSGGQITLFVAADD
ncbi:tyrosine-type recombinase/integrase [Streptomyces sp. NPDC056437]|uniref:tyrosine-type recombinase/integrase n=1 Tax=Streptomyces sp. NPDC056437 TaxID=3345816 RepID=UPI0036763521